MSVTTQGVARPRMPEWTRPTRLSSALFAAKVAAFQARRVALDLVSGPPTHRRADAAAGERTVAESVTPLWSEVHLAERNFQLGKVQNLRRAARSLDGLLIPAGQVFSFWRQVGPAISPRGYVSGRMLQEGCMVAATGGGLCQLSNALYDVALQAGCKIVERHAHSRIVPGSAAAYGRDATVAWNYVDLRWRPDQALRLSVRLTRDALVVRLLGAAPVTPTAPGSAEALGPQAEAARSCGTCDESDCFLHEHGTRARPPMAAARAFLVDEAWPEIAAYLEAARREGDRLGLPLDGGRWRLDRYRWQTAGFDRVDDAGFAALARSAAIRGAGAQGPGRRRAEIDGAAAIARTLGAKLAPDVTEAVVAQSLAPHLWREGCLGGRCYAVLMTRLPMGVLQARLDAAFAAHPDRASLADFRAPPELAEWEAQALAGAERIITPHAEIAALFGERAQKIDWVRPVRAPADRASPSRRIAFPGPTIARKGAHDLRAAAKALDLEVLLLGAELEGPGFWEGVRTTRPQGGDWLAGVAAVVQPAIVEDQPRRLLAALAAGVPVIATPACGLTAADGVRIVPADDADALAAVIGDVLA